MAEKRNLSVVVFGGNGYVGTALIEQWIKRDSNIEFFSISRSGKGKLNNSRVHYLKADVTQVQEVEAVMPEKYDYIIDCVGIYTKDKRALDTYNIQPVKVMLQIADKKSNAVLGYVGGIMGPKAFVESKASAIQMLKDSRHQIAYIEPTLIYGNGRNDSITKMVPIMNFFGLFFPRLRPVEVNQVVNDLINNLTQLQ